MRGTMDARGHAPATLRNRGPILEVLGRVLPASGTVLEVASGSGEHAMFFAAALPGVVWLPSEARSEALASIEAWRKASGVRNVRAAVVVDATSDDWLVPPVDAIFNANMIHIAPWQAALGLFRGAARHLRAGGLLVLYGPFRVGGAHTAPSNVSFDASLQARDSRWGVRDLEAVVGAAAAHGLELVERVAMPSNNLTVILRRAHEPEVATGAPSRPVD
jgi:SAM-dependent methyltransferase